MKALDFSVRTTAVESLGEVRRSLEEALNIRFTEGEFDEVDAYVAEFLGMKVGLYEWGDDLLLETRIEDPKFLAAAQKRPLEVVLISAPLADMLTVIGPFKWRVASDADLAKDAKFSDEFERRMAGEDPDLSWADDDK